MSIRFTQKHVEELQIGNLTAGQFLNIAIETSKLMGWAFSSINETGFIAHTNNGFFSWNAEVRLKIKTGYASLLSQSRDNEIIEFGKDKENLQKFMSVFNELRKSSVPEKIIMQYSNLQQDVA